MALKIECDLCGKPINLTEKQLRFIESAKQKEMNFIMLDCDKCFGHYVKYNPLTGQPPKKKRSSATVYRCPVSRCAGNVVYVKDEKEKFWGCGECGSVWYKKENLLSEIDAIVSKYAHRKKVYRKYKGQWKPVAVSKEPSRYDELVEKESPDKAKKYVRG